MNDKSPKKENKSSKVNRDENGRFASKDGGQKKNPDDGKVKINVVKEKKPNDKKAEKDSKAKDARGTDESVRIISIPFLRFRDVPWIGNFWTNWVDRVFSDHESTFAAMNKTFEALEREFDEDSGSSLKSFIENVSDKKPDTITINGRTYYSEEDVAKKIQQTISTCAETAAKEMAKVEAERNCQGQHVKEDTLPNMPEQAQHESLSGKTNTTAQRMANIAAKVIMWTFVAGFVATSIFGIVSLIRIIAR